MNQDNTDFISQIKKTYILELCESKGDNQFITSTLSISDPDHHGLRIELSFNDQGEISIFDTEPFRFSRFNIAEGYDQEEMHNAVKACLSGRTTIKRSVFGGYVMSIDLGKRHISGRLSPLTTLRDASGIKQRVSNILGGYAKR